MLAEPALGLRPWVSEACMLQGMTKLLGEGSLNQQNEDLEGGFDVKALIWGLDYDTTEGAVPIPGARTKAQAVENCGAAGLCGQVARCWSTRRCPPSVAVQIAPAITGGDAVTLSLAVRPALGLRRARRAAAPRQRGDLARRRGDAAHDVRPARARAGRARGQLKKKNIKLLKVELCLSLIHI